MKKTIIFTLLLTAIAVQTYAQAQKRDTVVLSVYNTNQRFMLYPMPFGKDRPDVDFTAPMLVARWRRVFLYAWFGFQSVTERYGTVFGMYNYGIK